MVRVLVQASNDDELRCELECIFSSDPIDLSERAQKRLIKFIERGLRPPSKKARTEETKHGE